jgi:membrane protein DedA with SNARE-associated domain
MSIAEITQSPIFAWLAQFAYHPQYVYLGIVAMMLASSFGLPIPEEVTLLSAGFLAFMGSRPDLFPPPYVGAPVVNMHEAAWISFFAVLGSDFLIYCVGRKYGRKLLTETRLKKVISAERLAKVESWTQKYGYFAVFIFRFTPGVRFPGHLACGILKFPVIKFLSVDCFAALISVPTQIYLLAIYGEHIMIYLKQFKIVIFAVIAAILVYLIYRRWLEHRSATKLRS